MLKSEIPKVRVLTLKGITLKGKNRVREHGTTWRVLRVANSGMLLIEPLVNHPHYARWIRPQADEHFKIVEDREMTDLQILNKFGLDNNRQSR